MDTGEEYLILIVDDDHTLCNALSKFFTGLGYKTVLAFNGLQAVEIYEELRPHLVILDIHMPVMDGIQFLARTRKNGATVPVIVTTAHPDINTAIEAIQSGAFDYIIKPFELDVLQQKVTRALQTTKLVRENTLLSQLVSLHEITNKLTSTHDLEELLDITFHYCLSVSKAETGSIQLVSKEANEIVIVRQKGIQLTQVRSSLDKPDEWAISKWVLKNGRSLLLSENEKLPDESLSLNRQEIGSSLSVPLKVSEEVIGVVNLNRGRNREQFSMVELNIINMLAAQASIAINNANLLSSIRQKLDELSLISTFSEQLMGLVDENDVIKCLFTTVQKHFPIDVIAFLIVQKRTHEFLYWSRGVLSQADLEKVCAEVIVEFNRATHSRVQQKRVTYRQLVPPMEFAPNIVMPLAFKYSVPIVGEQFDYGGLFFGAMKDLQDKHEQLTLLSSIVSQTRIALTNSKLYNDMKENYIRTIKALAIAVDAKGHLHPRPLGKRHEHRRGNSARNGPGEQEGKQHPRRRAAPRHRQDRHPRVHPQQARIAHLRGIQRHHEDPFLAGREHRQRRAVSPGPLQADPLPPRKLRRQRLSGRPQGGDDPPRRAHHPRRGRVRGNDLEPAVPQQSRKERGHKAA